METVPDKQSTWSTNFYMFCFAYAMNFDAAVTSFDIQNFVLGTKLHSIGTGTLMTIIVLASFPAGAVAGFLGPKKVQMLGIGSMLFYFIGYAMAAYMGKDSPSQWPLFMLAALGCGSGVALLGASAGPWVHRTADILCKQDPQLNRAEVSGSLLANLSIISHAFGIGFMFLLQILQDQLGVSYASCIVVYGCFSILALILMTMARDPPAPAGQQQEGEGIKRELQVTWSYYKEPRALLLSVAPLAMGIFSAWKSFDIVDVMAEPLSIGKQNVGIVNMVQSLTVIVCAKCFERAVPRCGTNPVMWLATITFLAASFLGLFTSLAHDGWLILVYFVFAGVCWAVMNTAFKVVLLDHFGGERASTAFAAYNMQTFVGQAVFYFMSVGGAQTSTVKIVCLLAFALLIMPALHLADRRRRAAEASSGQEKSKGRDSHPEGLGDV